MKTFVIDDDPISNMVTELMLQEEGFSRDITVFDSAEEALQVIAESKVADLPKVIFLDINMTLMNGWQFLDSLSPFEQKLKGNSRIFLLTSSLSTKDIERSKQYTMVQGFFHKPIQDENIRDILQELKNQFI